MFCRATLLVQEWDEDPGSGQMEVDLVTIMPKVGCCLREMDISGYLSDQGCRTTRYRSEHEYLNCPGQNKCEIWLAMASRAATQMVLI